MSELTYTLQRKMEKAGFFVIQSAVTSTTLWGIKDGSLTLCDIVENGRKVIALPISKKNIDKLCEELTQIADIYGEKLK